MYGGYGYAVNGEFWRVRTAAKNHLCMRPGCIIHKGERYADSVLAPWVTIQDDPEYPGHPLGSWERTRTHLADTAHNTDGDDMAIHECTTCGEVKETERDEFTGEWECEDCSVSRAEDQHERNMSEFYGGSRPHPADKPSNPMAEYLRQKGEL